MNNLEIKAKEYAEAFYPHEFETEELLFAKADIRTAYKQGFEDATKWYYPDNGEYLTEPNICIRYVDRSGDEFIGYTEWYYPSEDEVGYGSQIISVICNGEPVDLNDIKMWCELPFPPKEKA